MLAWLGFEMAAQRYSRQVLHDNVDVILRLKGWVKAHDVGMADVLEDPDFPPHWSPAIELVYVRFGVDFDCYLLIVRPMYAWVTVNIPALTVAYAPEPIYLPTIYYL